MDSHDIDLVDQVTYLEQRRELETLRAKLAEVEAERDLALEWGQSWQEAAVVNRQL